MQYLYLALAVLTSGYSGVCYKRVSAGSRSRADSALMPVIWFVPLTVVFLVIALATGGIDASAGVLLPALMGGIASAVCAYSLLESMKANSYSLAIIIVNLSFIFPVIFSAIFLHEKFHILQFIGMILAVAVILILNVGKGEGRSTPLALALAVLSSLGNGLIDFSIKIQQNSMPGEGEYSFFFFTYLFATAICIIMYPFFRTAGNISRKKSEDIDSEEERDRLKFDRKFFAGTVVPGLLIAVCNGVCFFSVSRLTGWMNAAAEFTVITSLSIVISLVVGFVRMRQKLTWREIVSLIFCAVAIACQYLNLI